MKHPPSSWTSHAGKHDSAKSALDETTVRPYGPSGVGILTEHPVGLLVIAAVILIAVVKLPPARAFFIASVVVGAPFGFFLWLYHYRKGF
jgi:hypothetical protein